MPSYVPLDKQLIADIPEPVAPAFKCRHADGLPTVCNRDATNYTEAVRTWGRKLQGKLKEIRELQPADSP